jgi:ABC-type nitrate/sulfonate/bicarbonate transport system substrate-binding protein
MPVAETVVVGTFTPSVLLAVARRTGRLGEHHIDAEERPVTSSPEQFRSLAEGGLDVAFTSPDNVLAYRFDPTNPLRTLMDVRILSTLDRGLGLGLYGRPGLAVEEPSSSWSFGVDVPTSGFALAMYALTEEFGLQQHELRVLALGSTPNRLKALLAGECDATMLNAGNELSAVSAGCRRLARATDTCAPYVGTVVCVHGERHLEAARRLCDALRATADEIVSGELDDLATGLAAELLDLPDALAVRFVDGLRSTDEGLIAADGVDRAGLRTVVALRQRYLPNVVDGRDVIDGALEDSSGLIDRRTRGT